jgi:translation elongation factor EF-1alpha
MGEQIGEVTHFYDRISVAVIQLSGDLKIGERIAIIGHTTEFSQTVESMQVNHLPIESAGAGDEIALKVWDFVRRGDLVYRDVETGPKG